MPILQRHTHKDREEGEQRGKNLMMWATWDWKQPLLQLFLIPPSSPFFLPFRGETQSTINDLFEITENMPGKGMYFEEVLNANSDKFKYKKILHMYAVIFEVERI